MSESKTYGEVSAPEFGVIVAKCCSCRRVREEGRWQFPQSPTDHNSMYSHTYCPACLKDAYATLEVFEVCAG